MWLSLLRLLVIASPGLSSGTPVSAVSPASVPVVEPVPISSLTKRRDLVLITVDALRADRLGAYGYQKGQSPRMDGLASESILFERAYASSPSTSFSIASIMLGRHGYAVMRESAPGHSPTLADRFARAGYQTAAIFPPAVYFSAGPNYAPLRARNFGFGRVVNTSFPDELDSAARTDQAIQVLDENADRRVFLWVHYFAPHEPYTLHPTSPFKLGPNPSESERYDGEVAWVDREIGRLLDYLATFRPECVVVLTADHGEEFGEHGGAYHGTALVDEQLRVPLFIRFPGFTPRRETGPISTAELPRVLMSLMEADADGRRADWAPGGSLPQSGMPVFAEMGPLKAVIHQNYKLICDLWANTCQLFDLARDPAERRNLSVRRPEVLSRLRRMLDTWIARDPWGDPTAPVDARTPEATLRRARRSDRQSAGALLAVATDSTLSFETRTEAARLLVPMVSSKHGSALHRLWTTEDSPLNRWLAVSLTQLGDRKAREWLATIEPLDDDPKFLVQRAVALAQRQDASSVPLVVQALQGTTDPNLRCLLLMTLSHLGGDEARATLLATYDKVSTRSCVATALETLRDPATLGFLREKIKTEPYVTVRAALVRALRKIGGPELHDDLRALRAQEQDPLVLAAAQAPVKGPHPHKAAKSR